MPVEGPITVIPAGTLVRKCTEENNKSIIEMSNNASNGTTTQFTFGYAKLTWFEPMAQIETLYSGQKLLLRQQ